ncbi:hypothetical protein CGRA01v4_06101 [Colletotrichum graminicola]|nr:hypothetical protein CGRA01v4_06101 [Colletotrichum graminicola]
MEKVHVRCTFAANAPESISGIGGGTEGGEV